jgi:pantoate--beta-alanine ligase
MAEVVTTKLDVRRAVEAARAAGKSIGFVPTMGALHAGHQTLVARAAAENGFVVLSIFVNPTQFGPTEDFLSYPRNLDADRASAEQAGAHLIFAPTAEEIYADSHSTWIEEETMTEGLCGARRPGHFRGVATVCLKLFNILRPDRAYFGLKDYQQYKVIERTVRDLDLPLEIIGVPTHREHDGLAMSSRNAYLSPEERQWALAIPRALQKARELIERGERSPRTVTDAVRAELVAEGKLKVEYIEIVAAADLELVVPLVGRVLIAVAVYCGDARLIDNVLVECRSEA